VLLAKVGYNGIIRERNWQGVAHISLAEGSAKAKEGWTLISKESIGGWRHVRTTVRGIKEDIPAVFFTQEKNR